MQGVEAPTGTFHCQVSAPAKNCSDSELLGRIADSGDVLAIRVLFKRYNLRVSNFVRRFVNDDNVAEDIASEVFVDLWRKAGQFRGESQVSTWIMGIARYKALSSLRRRRDDALDDATAEAIPDSADNPEVAFQKADQMEIMRECMSHLSQAHRQIIDLFYYNDKSVDEAAEIIGVPANTAKTRMFHARKRMSELLRQAGIDRTYQ
jgi:RNA polymerase sigma-70 factor (ECF subfamily)